METKYVKVKFTLADVWFDKAYNADTHDWDYCWERKAKALAYKMMENGILTKRNSDICGINVKS